MNEKLQVVVVGGGRLLSSLYNFAYDHNKLFRDFINGAGNFLDKHVIEPLESQGNKHFKNPGYVVMKYEVNPCWILRRVNEKKKNNLLYGNLGVICGLIGSSTFFTHLINCMDIGINVPPIISIIIAISVGFTIVITMERKGKNMKLEE